MFRKKGMQGFTLMECLWSLLVLALLWQAAIASLQYYRTVSQQMATHHDSEWDHFVMVFEAELAHYQLVQVEDHRLILEAPQQAHKRYSIIVNKGRLYKQPGFQPYLSEVAQWRLGQVGETLLYVEVTFTNGQTFQTYFTRPMANESPP